MEALTVYKTSDGKLFEDKEKAREHEASFTRITWISRWVEKHVARYLPSDGSTALEDALNEHWDELVPGGCPITPSAAAEKMRECFNSGDTEGAHCDADDLLCAVLRDLGYGEAVGIFENMEKWYA